MSENNQHIGLHNILPSEVFEVCKQGLYNILGQTLSGRYLFIVLKRIKNNEFRVFNRVI